MDARSQQNWPFAGEAGVRDVDGLTVSQARVAPSAGISSPSPYYLKGDPYSSHSVILSYLCDGRGLRVLDVGAAQGDLAQLLTQRGYDVTAIEGDPGLAAMARAKCREVVLADLDKPLPSLRGRFDVVVCGDILEHLKDPLGILLAITRLLRPDGIAIVSVPNIVHLWIRLQMCFGRFEYTHRGILDATHLRFFTLASFRRLLQQADLEILELKATPVPLPLVVPERYHGRMLNAVHAINAAMARTWKTLLAYQFVAVTRRRVSA
jgi:2-polyprenyl-3-methyl-5-hydroxy-6-metoxy-1,4-benzoquinol methylase